MIVYGKIKDYKIYCIGKKTNKFPIKQSKKKIFLNEDNILYFLQKIWKIIENYMSIPKIILKFNEYMFITKNVG